MKQICLFWSLFLLNPILCRSCRLSSESVQSHLWICSCSLWPSAGLFTSSFQLSGATAAESGSLILIFITLGHRRGLLLQLGPCRVSTCPPVSSPAEQRNSSRCDSSAACRPSAVQQLISFECLGFTFNSQSRAQTTRASGRFNPSYQRGSLVWDLNQNRCSAQIIW